MAYPLTPDQFLSSLVVAIEAELGTELLDLSSPGFRSPPFMSSPWDRWSGQSRRWHRVFGSRAGRTRGRLLSSEWRQRSTSRDVAIVSGLVVVAVGVGLTPPVVARGSATVRTIDAIGGVGLLTAILVAQVSPSAFVIMSTLSKPPFARADQSLQIDRPHRDDGPIIRLRPKGRSAP